MIDINEIDRLVELSSRPLNNQLDDLPLVSEERRNYYRFLYYLVMTFKPKLSLEIGIEGGQASIHMIEAGRQYGGHVIGLDLNPCPTETLRQDLNYLFIQGDSTEQASYEKVAGYVGQYGPLSLVFQDSSHHYRPSLDEWGLYSEFLTSPAVWVCDDITSSFHDPKVDPPGKGMIEYFKGLPGTKKLYTNMLHRGNTMGVVLL